MYKATKSGRKFLMPTDKENSEIIEQAKEDGTQHTIEELEQFKPASEFSELQAVVEETKKKRGRPVSENPKKLISIRYDEYVIDYFKATGKGWQSRMNEVLGEYVKSH